MKLLSLLILEAVSQAVGGLDGETLNLVAPHSGILQTNCAASHPGEALMWTQNISIPTDWYPFHLHSQPPGQCLNVQPGLDWNLYM